MNLITSFCTQHSRENLGSRWYSNDTVYYSWMNFLENLQNLNLKPTLYTDSFGAELLVDKLNLPFSNVQLIYDDIDPKYTYFYWYPKYLAASMQSSAFAHVDYDLFMKQNLSLDIQNSDVFYERKFHKSDIKKFKNVMQFESLGIDQFILDKKSFEKSNFFYGTGIFGGNNNTYFQSLHNLIKCIAENYSSLNQVNFETIKTLEYFVNACHLANNNLEPTVITDENRKSLIKYTHVFDEKDNPVINGKIKLSVMKNVAKRNGEIIDERNRKYFAAPKLTLLFLGSKFGNPYATIKNLIIPKSIKFDEIIISAYNIPKYHLVQLMQLDNLRFVREGDDFSESLSNCIRFCKSDAVLIVDANVDIDYDCIQNAYYCWLNDRNSIYCATVYNKESNLYLQGMNFVDDYKFMNITNNLDNTVKKIDFVTGGFYILSKKILQQITKNNTKYDSFEEIVEKTRVPKFCISQSVVRYLNFFAK